MATSPLSPDAMVVMHEPHQRAQVFEKAYAERSGMTVERLREHSKVVPCDCDYEACEGWGMVSLDSATCGECGHYDFIHDPESGLCVPDCRCQGVTKERRWP